MATSLIRSAREGSLRLGASGARNDRPVLAEAMKFVGKDDILVAVKLDRVARSLPHLPEAMDHLNREEIGFQSLTEEINTTTPGGRLIFHVMAAISEFERDLIRERTSAGLKAAKARGRVWERLRKMTDEKKKPAERLLALGTPVQDVASMLSISVPTLYRWRSRSGR